MAAQRQEGHAAGHKGKLYLQYMAPRHRQADMHTTDDVRRGSAFDKDITSVHDVEEGLEVSTISDTIRDVVPEAKARSSSVTLASCFCLCVAGFLAFLAEVDSSAGGAAL